MAQQRIDRTLPLFHFLKHRLSFVEDAITLAGIEPPPLRPAEAHHLVQDAGTLQGQRHRRHLGGLGTDLGGCGHGAILFQPAKTYSPPRPPSSPRNNDSCADSGLSAYAALGKSCWPMISRRSRRAAR